MRLKPVFDTPAIAQCRPEFARLQWPVGANGRQLLAIILVILTKYFWERGSAESKK